MYVSRGGQVEERVPGKQGLKRPEPGHVHAYYRVEERVPGKQGLKHFEGIESRGSVAASKSEFQENKD